MLAGTIAACSDDDGSPHRTPTPSATRSATGVATPSSTRNVTNAATASATPNSAASATSVATATTAATATSTALPTDTAPPAPTPTTAATDTAQPSPTATLAATVSQTPADTATVTPTRSPSIVDQLVAVGIGRYLDITPTSMTSTDIFDDYRFDPAAEQAICLRGTEYRVLVHHGTVNKVLLYLEGGGACWSYETCWQSPAAKLTADPLFGPVGILDFDNPDNPFHGWSVVYAPYCDGSVFGGDNVVDYQDNPAYHTFHHGQQNVSAAVALMREQFPDPEQIVVSGSSAGGYGTYSGYGVARVAYPEAPILVLNDSGPGIQNNDATQDVQDRLTNWKFTEQIPPTCTRCSEQIAYLSEWGLERDPTLRVGYFSNLQDVVIRSFNRLTAEQFEALLRQVTDDIHSRQPERFKRFFIQGSSHTIVELPAFYTTEIAGTSLRDWTADLLTDGPAWLDLIEGANPFKGFKSARYADEQQWLCRPDQTTTPNQCAVNDLTATVVLPNNTLAPEIVGPPRPEPDYDCFYVYPTVDLSVTPGNHTDFSDLAYILDPLVSQAARFNRSCRVFAPLYRQVTIGTYFSNDPHRDEYFALAYSDVKEAFRHYMGQYNNGRNFVLMGHSQGTGHVTQLIQELIDPDPELRERLIAALLIGGSVAVPDGEVVGGTFQNIPLCTTANQAGCVIAYRSYAHDFPPAGGSNVVDANLDTACTNPAALGGGKGLFAASYFPLHVNQPTFRVGTDIGLPIDTAFADFPGFYSGECVKDDHGKSYLEIGVDPGPGDVRTNPIPFANPLFGPALLGMHVLDYNFALGDLIQLVERKAALLKAAQSIE
jgi:hypothetical protein